MQPLWLSNHENHPPTRYRNGTFSLRLTLAKDSTPAHLLPHPPSHCLVLNAAQPHPNPRPTPPLASQLNAASFMNLICTPQGGLACFI